MVNAVEFILNIQLACLAIVFTFMALSHRSDRVLRLVWFSFLALGLGGLVDLFRLHLPAWISFGINFEAAPVSYALLNLAMVAFVGRGRWTRWYSLALLLGALPFLVYWSVTPHALIYGVAVVDFAMALQTSCIAWVLLNSSERSTRTPRLTMSTFLALFAADNLYRAGVVAFLHVSPAQFQPVMEWVTASIYVLSVSILPLNIIWLVNARMQNDLSTASRRDPLTELLNRRGLAEAADRELLRYARAHQDFAVAIADIDLFKQLNDTYGHACGDEMLRHISGLFREMLRQSDVVCRSGGEEFVFLLPMTAAEETFAALDRLRAVIAHRPVFTSSGVKVHATISFGMTNTKGRLNPTLADLEREADIALYAAKKAGRNRSVLYTEAIEPAAEIQVESLYQSTRSQSAA